MGKNREIFIIGDRMVINVCIPTIFSAKVETDEKGNIEEEKFGEEILSLVRKSLDCNVTL